MATPVSVMLELPANRALLLSGVRRYPAAPEMAATSVCQLGRAFGLLGLSDGITSVPPNGCHPSGPMITGRTLLCTPSIGGVIPY
ncbi:hypothetical protein OG394_10200 [Kribbella sp. NBC_01245]|uniref:hypothetical protein n=1 Tax=Kribbella sp. NBC_01245 TaxID=2903578 RepID=UPI002E298671|nr:hypothetical protein [Kribbella sp. NBC_01245]